MTAPKVTGEPLNPPDANATDTEWTAWAAKIHGVSPESVEKVAAIFNAACEVTGEPLPLEGTSPIPTRSNFTAPLPKEVTGEPVAWQSQEHGTDEWYPIGKEAFGVNPQRYKYRALYAHPPPAQPLHADVEAMITELRQAREGFAALVVTAAKVGPNNVFDKAIAMLRQLATPKPTPDDAEFDRAALWKSRGIDVNTPDIDKSLVELAQLAHEESLAAGDPPFTACAEPNIRAFVESRFKFDDQYVARQAIIAWEASKR